jgi:hypothetical protein
MPERSLLGPGSASTSVNRDFPDERRRLAGSSRPVDSRTHWNRPDDATQGNSGPGDAWCAIDLRSGCTRPIPSPGFGPSGGTVPVQIPPHRPSTPPPALNPSRGRLADDRSASGSLRTTTVACSRRPLGRDRLTSPAVIERTDGHWKPGAFCRHRFGARRIPGERVEVGIAGDCAAGSPRPREQFRRPSPAPGVADEDLLRRSRAFAPTSRHSPPLRRLAFRELELRIRPNVAGGLSGRLDQHGSRKTGPAPARRTMLRGNGGGWRTESRFCRSRDLILT